MSTKSRNVIFPENKKTLREAAQRMRDFYIYGTVRLNVFPGFVKKIRLIAPIWPNWDQLASKWPIKGNLEHANGFGGQWPAPPLPGNPGTMIQSCPAAATEHLLPAYFFSSGVWPNTVFFSSGVRPRRTFFFFRGLANNHKKYIVFTTFPHHPRPPNVTNGGP